MRTICHIDDAQMIELISPNLETGPWICGGAALSWYNNKPAGLSDIDVFFASEEQFRTHTEKFSDLKSAYPKLILCGTHASINATTYKIGIATPPESLVRSIATPPVSLVRSLAAKILNLGLTTEPSFLSIPISELTVPTWNVQYIKHTFYDNIDQVLDQFDITVCKIGTDGNSFYTAAGAAADIHNKVLRMKYPLKSECVKRLFKYWSYGYEPTHDLLDKIQLEQQQLNWEFDDSDSYNGAF